VPTTPETGGTARRAEAIHDFTGKLRQPGMWPLVVDYVKWQRATRTAKRDGARLPPLPELVPLSINLDLTTACNYKCDHCIDWDILNQPQKHEEQELRSSLTRMAKRGLKSVILIGGGEPTLFPPFPSFVQFLKELQLQVAVVSNGSRNDRILQAAPYFTRGDWVRLSLDSGSNATFQRMHNPARASLTLDEICAWIPKIKATNPHFELGFSFIITWRGGTRDDVKVVENMGEIVMAAQRARDAGFDYISFKPFLERSAQGSEVMDPKKTEERLQSVVARITASIDAAKQLERPGFRVMESTNLRTLVQGNWEELTAQPKTCHMQSLRQVLTPLGLYNCPAYRGVPYARIGEKDGYKDATDHAATAARTAHLLETFDASRNCAEVTCLYNGTNWWLEKLIESSVDPAAVEVSADRGDYFL
jgi:pyruvate-formate lyase-activating enzyme